MVEENKQVELSAAAFRSPQGTVYDAAHVYRMESEIKGDPEPLVAVPELIEWIESFRQDVMRNRKKIDGRVGFVSEDEESGYEAALYGLAAKLREELEAIADTGSESKGDSAGGGSG